MLEDLARDLRLTPGMRVLDLGSGKGATSVFLSREFGVKVVAADLWIDPAEAAATFAEAQLVDQIEAVRAEAHTLPFAKESFDAIISIVGWEAIAWHTAERWRFQWSITELVTVTSARSQDHGWAEWLRWARAKNLPDEASVVTMLEADQGELLSFALVTAVK